MAKGIFKTKAQDILKPSSMGDFLKDYSVEEPKNIIKSCTQPQHKQERLHLQIRKDLYDKLINQVMKRKMDKSMKKVASQKAIIEESLEAFFQNE